MKIPTLRLKPSNSIEDVADGIEEADVVGDRAGEQRLVLHDDADAVAPGALAQLRQRHAGDQHDPGDAMQHAQPGQQHANPVQPVTNRKERTAHHKGHVCYVVTWIKCRGAVRRSALAICAGPQQGAAMNKASRLISKAATRLGRSWLLARAGASSPTTPTGILPIALMAKTSALRPG